MKKPDKTPKNNIHDSLFISIFSVKENLQDLLKGTLPEELSRFVPLFDYILFNTNRIEDYAILKQFKNQGVKLTIWIMKRNNNIINFIEENPTIAGQILHY